MKIKKIEKMIKKEGNGIIPNVFDNILDSLEIENITYHKKNKLYIPLISSFATLALTLSIVIPMLNKPKPLTLKSNTYVAIKIETSQDESGYLPEAYSKEGSPSFTYEVNKNGKTDKVIAVNDSAKIVSRGLNLKDDVLYQADMVASSIVAQSTSIGFINLSSKNNIVHLTVSGISDKAREIMIDKISKEITKYFKDNYIYGAVIPLEIDNGENIIGKNNEEKDEKYIAIYSIYELTKELFLDIYNSPSLDLENNYSTFESWQTALKDVELEKLNLAVTRLKDIRSQFLKYDFLKENFSINLKNLYESYSNSYEYVLEDRHFYDLSNLLDITSDLITELELEQENLDNRDKEELKRSKEKYQSLKAILDSDGRKYSFYDWLFFESIDFSSINKDDSFEDLNHNFSNEYEYPDDWYNWTGEDEWDDNWEDEWDNDWIGWEDDYRHRYHNLDSKHPISKIDKLRQNISLINKKTRYIMKIQEEYRYGIKRILATLEYWNYEFNYDEKFDEYGNSYHDNRDNHWEDNYDYDSWYNEWNHHH